MHSSIKDLPIAFEAPNVTLRLAEWGNMTVEVGEIGQAADATPLFKGLPDDRCQCPHWGYVVKGQLRLKFADHEEIYDAGDLYYAPPGHTPVDQVGCVYLDFSPTDEMRRTMEVLARNLKALQAEVSHGTS
jgi:hypothetical protein